MTTEKKKDFYLCPTGEPHIWTYKGSQEQTYRCARCAMLVTKKELKEATD